MSDTRSEVKVGVDQINNTDVIYYDNDDAQSIKMNNIDKMCNPYLMVFAGHNEYLDIRKYNVQHSNRLLVYIEFNKVHTKYLLIIMKNPSYFSPMKSDKAMNRIIKYMRMVNNQNEYKGVFIMNLCSSRGVVAKHDIVVNDDYNDLNKSIFDLVINQYQPDILLGTGDSLHINNTYQYLMLNDYLVNSRCFNDLDDASYPRYCGNHQGRNGTSSEKLQIPFDLLNRWYDVLYNECYISS